VKQTGNKVVGRSCNGSEHCEQEQKVKQQGKVRIKKKTMGKTHLIFVVVNET